MTNESITVTISKADALELRLLVSLRGMIARERGIRAVDAAIGSVERELRRGVEALDRLLALPAREEK